MADSHREHPAVELARAATARARRAAEDGRAAYDRARQAQDRLRQTEAKVSETEAHIATTLRALAAAARANGRIEDADRLDHEATLAENGSAEARQQSLPAASSGGSAEGAPNTF
jgi:uncharacterized membrane protein YebE (DUF533 family)